MITLLKKWLKILIKKIFFLINFNNRNNLKKKLIKKSGYRQILTLVNIYKVSFMCLQNKRVKFFKFHDNCIQLLM